MSLQSLVNFSLREPTWVQALSSSIKCHAGCSCVRCCTCICLAAGHAGSWGQIARFSLIVLAIDLKKLRSRLVSAWLLRLMSDGAGAFMFLVFWKAQCVRVLALKRHNVEHSVDLFGAFFWLRGRRKAHVIHRICAHDSQTFFCKNAIMSLNPNTSVLTSGIFFKTYLTDEDGNLMYT